VLAADEAMYDSYLTTPAGHQGVTFVASTGDYGANVPQYPAFSPNVVAVGGTSLYLNGDNSYAGESAWGGMNNSSGTFLGGGGGVSLYEAEPAYQTGVQSTGHRTTPDVSFVADPTTGAWIADTYNLSASNPWQVVGGTSLSAPAFAALFAIVNQGRVTSGLATLNTTSPLEAQQALYSLPTSDYHDVTNGNNGYAAGAGYDLATGLGTPVANLLVPGLVAYNGAGNNPSWQVTVSSANATPASNSSAVANALEAQINALPVFNAVVVGGMSADAAAAESMPADQVATSELSAIPTATSDLSAALGTLKLLTPANEGADLISANGQVFIELAQGGDTASTSGSSIGPARLQGSADDDVLIGGDGNDLLIGGDGQGMLVGGIATVRPADDPMSREVVPPSFDEMIELLAAEIDDAVSPADADAALDAVWSNW
jgi:hypothetical protein